MTRPSPKIFGRSYPIAIDLFAGAGGATVGLKAAGYRVVLAVENHADAASTFRSNHPDVLLVEQDIRNIRPVDAIANLGIEPGKVDVLNSCPPCQGFSSLYKGTQDHARNDLVLETGRWLIAVRPRVLILENVPRLRNDERYGRLLSLLRRHGYRFTDWIVDAHELGAPQRRRRLILLACRDSGLAFPNHLLEALPENWIFERDARTAIMGLGRVGSRRDALHVARTPSPTVRKRLQWLPVGGTRFDLPSYLQLNCHKKLSMRDATGSYGRIPSSGPCGTLTTRCTTPACGPFVHPRSPRGLSLREAAILQTFPRSYKFSGRYDSVERQIGNAVPPRLTNAVATAARRFL
jgi:DNA (cytosine-5)-methyltransferase 1